MKKPRINYLHDSFIDYKGNKHFITICSISVNLPKNINEYSKYKNEDATIYYQIERFDDFRGSEYFGNCVKCLHIGYSICNPTDEYSMKEGNELALKRASKSEPTIWTTDAALINSSSVDSIMRKKLDMIKNSPNNYIKNYNIGKAKFEEIQNAKKELEELNLAQKNLKDAIIKIGSNTVNKIMNLLEKAKINV